MRGDGQPRCMICRFFRNDTEYLEAVFPGLTALSSAQGSTRADDGICIQHDRYVSATSSCKTVLIAGLHFPSDIEARRMSAIAAMAVMMQSPAHRADFAEARAELRAVLGLSP